MDSDDLAITLFMKNPNTDQFWNVESDGPSYALINRLSLLRVWSEEKWHREIPLDEKPYFWVSGKKVSQKISLDANATKIFRLHFDLPKGEYDFISAYGGGVQECESLVSNFSAFDIGEKGKGKRIEVKGR